MIFVNTEHSVWWLVSGSRQQREYCETWIGDFTAEVIRSLQSQCCRTCKPKCFEELKHLTVFRG